MSNTVSCNGRLAVAQDAVTVTLTFTFAAEPDAAGFYDRVNAALASGRIDLRLDDTPEPQS